MSTHPILLVGGSGTAGRWTARFLREAHPDVPLLIGGRDLEKARQVAAEIGGTEGVKIDLRADNLGLGARQVSAVSRSRWSYMVSPIPPYFLLQCVCVVFQNSLL